MIKNIILTLILVGVLTGNVPCTVTDESPLGDISDCTASKHDDYSLSWGVKISFKESADFRSDNWVNLLSDNVHPRFPYFPLGGECQTQYGKFEAGQSILLNCTQEFEAIPHDYVNTVLLFEDNALPLVFEMKLPLSQVKNHLRSDGQ
jgi:hypothetical protein